MSRDECPCKGCTAETGRSPTCHSKDCPRGWYEWDQRHKAARKERNAEQWGLVADSVLIAGAKRRRRR